MTRNATMHPETLVGNTYHRLMASGLFAADWGVEMSDLVQEVIAVLINVWGWPEAASTYARAESIAILIAGAYIFGATP